MEATWDVFISYSSNNKPVVRDLAERLRADGLRVWFDEWQIQAGDSIPARIEEGLEHSRVLLLCMSAQAFGSDWAQLESGTFRFRAPLNKNRRFIPVRLDDAVAPGSLAQFKYIDWRRERREAEYPSLVAACRPRASAPASSDDMGKATAETRVVSLGHSANVFSVAISPDGTRALSGAGDKTVRLWNLETSHCLKVMEGHAAGVFSVAISPDGTRALSGAEDKTVRLWNLENSGCLKIMEGHTDRVRSVTLTPDGKRALSGAWDKTVRLWDLETGRCLSVMEGHTASVMSVAICSDGKRAISGADDKAVRLWELDTGRCLSVMEGHTAIVMGVAVTPDGRRALSGAWDQTVRLWDLETGRCLKVFNCTENVSSVAISHDGTKGLSGDRDGIVRVWALETGLSLKVMKGGTARVLSVAISLDGKRALSSAEDNTVRMWDLEGKGCPRTLEGHNDFVYSVAISADGRRSVSVGLDKSIRVWDIESARCLKVMEGHTASVNSVMISTDGKQAISGSEDRTARLWNLEQGKCLKVLEGHRDGVYAVAISPDGSLALSGAADESLRLWDIESGRCLKVLKGHALNIRSVAISPNGRQAVSGGMDGTLRLWDLEEGRCLKVLRGHTFGVYTVTISPDGKRALSGAEDNTVRLWDLEGGRCLQILEGHSDIVDSVTIGPDGKRALSGSRDCTVRLWDLESSRCLKILGGHTDGIVLVAIRPGGWLFSAACNGVLRIRRLTPETEASSSITAEVPYTNAKVLLVGDSGVGKTGLARYLADGINDQGEKTSTDGAWATQWSLPHTKERGVDREIWLWDFAGQVDYRLVHQLFMDDAAAAILVFDPQDRKLFDGLGEWDRDLAKATGGKVAKLIAAGRVDRGGLVVSKVRIMRFMAERGFHGDLHLTSAKTGQGCDNLREAIVASIEWERLAVIGSPILYRRMKEEILRLRDSAFVMLRMAELKQRMEMALKDEAFDLAQLETVVGLLAGPGMISRVGFGDFILLRPDVISRYAAALVRKVRSHPKELGCISEADLLDGNLDYHDFRRLPRDDEAVILRHLNDILVKRAWCLRQICDGTTTLTFPSYFNRERPEQPSHPNIVVSYRFAGPVDDIYATLVVRLHHTTAFEADELWKSAADFKTQDGQSLGILLTRESEGKCRLDAYFATDVDENSRMLFLRYVHDHLVAHAQEVVRLRHYACANKRCESRGEPFDDRAKIDKALAPGGKGRIFCPVCGKPIQLRDRMERKFESPEVKEEARKQAEVSQFEIDSESREQLAVHHTGFVVAEAGQIYRGYTNSDHGIDGEIEFKDDQGRATGRRLYLQLKSGDSYLTVRQRDRAEVFRIKKRRWAQYWQQQAYPVMLVIRTSDGVIRWMNISAYLRRRAGDIGRQTMLVVFEGERMDAASVRRYRDSVIVGK